MNRHPVRGTGQGARRSAGESARLGAAGSAVVRTFCGSRGIVQSLAPVVRALSNPVRAGAVLCALLVYSGAVVPRERGAFASLFADGDICALEGVVSSTPVKTAAYGGTYRARLSVTRASTASGGSSSARGAADVYFPAAIVESRYPGRRYSAAGRSAGVPVESGARLAVGVRAAGRGGAFIADSAEARGWRGGIPGAILQFRAACRLRFLCLMGAWGGAGALVLALLSGSRAFLEPSLVSSFRGAGLSHILALSGMHLSLFGGLARAAGKRAAGRRAAEAARLGAIVFFVWFAGLSPSLFRALLCAVLVQGAAFLRLRRPDGLSVLAAAFLVHAAVFPAHLREAAFMLSYGALAGIIVLAPVVRRILVRALVPPLAAPLADSAGANAFTAPVSAAVFGSVSPAGIIASPVVSPLVTVFLYAALAGIALCIPLPFLAAPFGVVLNALYAAIRASASVFALVPALSFGGSYGAS